MAEDAPPVKRSALRRRVAPEPSPEPAAAGEPPRRRPSRDPEPAGPEAREPVSPGGGRNRAWTFAGLGAVVGGGLVFAGLSVLSLKRNTSPAPAYPMPARAARAAGDADAVAALAAHKKASAREINSLLASQQVVWQFFATATADAARPLVAPEMTAPLPAAGVQTPLTRLALRSKHRLPDDAGLASQWTVTTARFGELVVDVTETGGQPRIDWDKLATQIGAQAALSPDQRTAATP